MTQYTFSAIGTSWRIDIYDELDDRRAAEILKLVHARIDEFDLAYSRFRADSLVTKMSQEAGVYKLPDDARPMMDLYHDLYMRTNGYMTPLIGNAISDAGYDADYSLKQKKPLERPPAWDDALHYEHPELAVKIPVLLDFGAAGKGYLIDIVADVLRSQGVTHYGIDAGGDIRLDAPELVRIGLEDPHDTTQVVGICTLKRGSLCGSAGNRRAWGDYTHIINPKTLTSPTEISAVWVAAQTTLLADALTTCLFFVPAEGLRTAYEFEYLIVYRDRSVEKSPLFPAELFLM